MPTLSCRICRHSGEFKTYIVREMMFGLGETYEYFQCQACGCLQIKDIPENISKYYPKEYYALQKLEVQDAPAFKAWLRKKRAASYVQGNVNLEPLWALLFGRKDFFTWLKALRAGFDDKILDIGAGNGGFLRDLRLFGYTDLTGVDPFIDEDLRYAPGLVVLKRGTQDLQGPYDRITANHSLEHVSEPLIMLKEIHRLLKPDGRALIRVPLATSYAWEHYGVDWVQLDAPRHFFLHSLQSIALLADQAGFKITRTDYDSLDFSLWGSEQYKKNIPLNDPNSYNVSRKNSIFSRWEILSMRAKARKLNRERRGDSACFYLIKK
jgi:SAM-dependent methyltransferase